MNDVRLLLLEDDHLTGELLIETLNEHGFNVSWFVRASLIKAVLHLTDINGQLVPLEGAHYDVAAVDGRLKMSPIEWGYQVTPHLVKANVPVVAVSGDHFLNEQMIAFGAKAGAPKHHWWCPPIGSEDIGNILHRVAKR